MSAHIRKCAEAISSNRVPTNKIKSHAPLRHINGESIDILAQICGIPGRPWAHCYVYFCAKATDFTAMKQVKPGSRQLPLFLILPHEFQNIFHIFAAFVAQSCAERGGVLNYFRPCNAACLFKTCGSRYAQTEDA